MDKVDSMVITSVVMPVVCNQRVAVANRIPVFRKRFASLVGWLYREPRFHVSHTISITVALTGRRPTNFPFQKRVARRSVSNALFAAFSETDRPTDIERTNDNGIIGTIWNPARRRTHIFQCGPHGISARYNRC